MPSFSGTCFPFVAWADNGAFDRVSERAMSCAHKQSEGDSKKPADE